MHARGGFQQDDRWSDLWAVVIDVVCVAIFVWILSGFHLWWLLKRTRLWGSLSIAAGFVAAAVFPWGL